MKAEIKITHQKWLKAVVDDAASLADRCESRHDGEE